MNDLHITESIAILALCLGYLTIVIGNALAYRIRYGKLPVGSMVPFEAKQAAAAARATKRRGRPSRPGRDSTERELASPAVIVDAPAARTSGREYELEARLEAQGIAIPIARAAARHARATLGDGADPADLVQEALRACPVRPGIPGSLQRAA